MSAFVAKPYRKRFLFSLVFLSTLAALFWTQSRYPSLNEKAMMSGAIQLEDPLSFEAGLPVLPGYPVWKKIKYSTLNWIKTNRQGMTFGLFFGAAFLTLFGYIRRKSFEGGFANSFLGLFMGAPLGVCVNCAAPIAKGLYAGGARAEATLAAMTASPTLNVVVLTMLFSLLPFYMAVTKIVLSLVVILVVVPLICRLLPVERLQVASVSVPHFRAPDPAEPAPEENAVQAALRFLRDYAVNLWFIVRTTVPLMLLAGFLGAVVATLVPAGYLTQASFGVAGLAVATVIGTFLPVPIGFDVVASATLLGSGLASGYVMALLFTLGIFSVYSFFIVATSISLRAASLMAVAIACLGAAAGLGIDRYHDLQMRKALEILTGFELSLVGSAAAAEAGAGIRTIPDGANTITLTRLPFAPPSPGGEKPFTRVEAWHLGIDQPLEFSFGDMWPPFWEGRSISAGDFDNDGDSDLVIASTERGLYAYLNDGRGRFARRDFDIGMLATLPVFNAGLVDIDNDGWLDLFVATYKAGNFVLKNEAGVFDARNLARMRNRDDAILTLAASFGDVDKDGDLDLALGNWAAGWYRRIPGEEATNRIVFNDDGSLSGEHFRELPGPPGETLSILLTDLDMDGALDLLEGNDFEQPDIFSLGDGKGGFTPIARQDGIVPHSTTTTMSFKTADLHNDGVPKIYVAQIAGRSSGVRNLKLQSFDRYCDGIERAEDLAACRTNMAIKRWYRSGHSFDPGYAGRCLQLEGRQQVECKAMLVKDLAIQSRDPSICKLIPVGQPRARDLCEIHFRPIRQPTAEESAAAIPQIMRSNVLLTRGADGRYRDTANEEGLGVGGWSWDVKIGDVDLDGWQDVYIVNGTWVPNEVSPSNLFYRNTGDGRFEELSGPYGLEDYLITAAAAQTDIDGDGDLDFVTVPVNGPPIVFLNNTAEGHAIAFAVRDEVGNRFGIGSKIVIRHGEGRQMREVQLGGGFMSFDEATAHFGLGDVEEVDAVTIEWSTGGSTSIEGPLAADALYRIERAPAATR